VNKGYFTAVGVCAPINGQIEKTEEFYKSFQTVENESIILMEDRNAHTGNMPIKNVISTTTEPTLNANGKEFGHLSLYDE
jgi:hypothetical protein